VKVAYLGHTAALSGGELATLHLLEELPEIDRLVILAEDGPLVPRLVAAGATVEVLPLPTGTRTFAGHQLGSLRTAGTVAAAGAVPYAARLAQRLRSAGVDLVHTFTLKSALYGGLAGRLARRPVVWSIQDRIAPDYVPPGAVRLVRTAARVLPSAVIVNSRATAATLPAEVAPTVVHPAVPVRGPLPLPPEPPFVVGMVGRLVSWKGHDVFLRAFAEAFGGDGGAVARVVGAPLLGDESWERELRDLTRRLGIDGVVGFRGFRDDVRGELAHVHVVVHASTTPEPFGQVIVEAMDAGRAVVAAALGGPTEIVTDGVDGCLVAPGDVSGLAATLRRLRDDEPLRRALGEAAVRRATSFAADRAATDVRAVYRSLLLAPTRS
jgi:glycosyltransferase involved in cell wall biosynthesis